MNEFLHSYWEIFSDPAHLAAELSFMLLIDVLLLGILVPVFKRVIRREHRKIDAEHGYEHEKTWFFSDEPGYPRREGEPVTWLPSDLDNVIAPVFLTLPEDPGYRETTYTPTHRGAPVD